MKIAVDNYIRKSENVFTEPYNKRFINLVLLGLYGKVFAFGSSAQTSLLRRSVCTKTSCKYFPVQTSLSVNNALLLYGFAESWILIGRRAVRKMRIRTVVRIFPYPDRFPVCQIDRLEFETFLHVYKVVM